MENPTQKTIIYQTTEDNQLKVRLEDENIWLTQQQMAQLYQCSRTNVVEHIKNIYQEGELQEEATCRNFRQVQTEGNREVSRELPFYNLDMIISLGYRIKSHIATKFRIWATERLKEYIVKGFTLNDERLKNLGGGNHWKELLDRIRDIRSSEKVISASTGLVRHCYRLRPQKQSESRFFQNRAEQTPLRCTRQYGKRIDLLSCR